MLKSRKRSTIVRPYLVTCVGADNKIELVPIVGFSRGEVALTTKELWPHLSILNVTENPDWND